MAKIKSQKSNSDSIEIKVSGVFQKNGHSHYNYKQMSKAVGISDPAGRQLVQEAIHTLLKSKEIIEVKKGKYKLNPKLLSHFQNPKAYVTGFVDMKKTGKAYVITKELEEDIFIASNNTNQALNGDEVKVLLFPQRSGKKTEGQITEIISRNKIRFVGKIDLSENFAFFIPDSQNMPVDIFIPLVNINGAKNGEKVIAEITDWPKSSKNPFGKIVEVLGMPGVHQVEMHSILAEYDFPLCFTASVEAEAKKIPDEISAEEISKRRDFRNIITFTRDPVDAKDFDDALSIKKLPNNNWEVGVHIADVSHYVKPNSMLDEEAYERGTSVYLVDRVIPMLPEHLSNGVCSLMEKTDKLCFSAVFELDNDAKIITEWFGKTIIHSNKRFSYEEVQQIIESKCGEFVDEILTLDDLAKKLQKARFANGSIAFKSTEVKFRLDENSAPIGVYVKEQKDSNKLVEDFMLLANRRVAEFVNHKKDKNSEKTFVYRIHANPNQDKLEKFIQFVGKLGYKMKTGNRVNLANSFNTLLSEISGKPEEYMITELSIRTMEKARYSTKNIGHYGLAFDNYTHFTSPIRRYPDLMVHRLLENYLHNGASANRVEYEEKCEHCSEQEYKAAKAERESIKYKQVEFLVNKIGMRFDGIISGVSKWGIFVKLTENMCEGLVSLKDMDDDFYYLDEDNHCVVGHHYGNIYRLGDPVKIIVKKADLSKKELDFIMVGK